MMIGVVSGPLQTIQVLSFRGTQHMKWLEKNTKESALNNSTRQNFMTEMK
jgi:hypothetical protein